VHVEWSFAFTYACRAHDYAIWSRRRERKPATTFQPTYTSFGSKNAVNLVLVGDGDALHSIPAIESRLGAAKAASPEVKLLHKAIFGDEGEDSTRIRKLLEFRGLSGKCSAITDSV
jgi:hypothetical protein